MIRQIGYADPVALGHISNDPVFGQTTANIYFSFSSTCLWHISIYQDHSVEIDSVVLSLGYAGALWRYQHVSNPYRCTRLPQSSTFKDTELYRFNEYRF